MENTTTTPDVPNSPQELMRKNNSPLSPEVIWEEYDKMSVKEKEVFIWNCVEKMKNFHFWVVEKMMKEDEYTKEDIGVWVQDGTKWNELLRLLNGMLND